MKNAGFIIQLEFKSSVIKGYYSEKVFGSYYSIIPAYATIFGTKRSATYYVIDLVRKYSDIKLFNIIPVKY